MIFMIAKRLQKGDTIGIVAPSNPITLDRKITLDMGIKYLENEGFKIVFSKNALLIDKFESSGGTPEQRADDINDMFKDKKINAIWCAHGGDTANQTLDLIDYKLIKNNPKIFMGMSDIDVLLLAINRKTGLITFNAADPKRECGHNLDIEYSQKSFVKRMLNGEKEIISNSCWKISSKN